MSIDEAIKKYKDITNQDISCPRYCMCICDECVQEHEQIAEWLEELKALRHEANELRKAGYAHGHTDGYDKAIDGAKSVILQTLDNEMLINTLHLRLEQLKEQK